jgi:hypothetical protein
MNIKVISDFIIFRFIVVFKMPYNYYISETDQSKNPKPFTLTLLLIISPISLIRCHPGDCGIQTASYSLTIF